MTNEQMREAAEMHHFATEERDGRLYVLVPWTMRLHDGAYAEGVDRELVGSAGELMKVLGY